MTNGSVTWDATNNRGTITATHQYAPGVAQSQQISVTVADDDGGVSNTASIDVQIAGLQLTAAGELIYTGSPLDDELIIDRDGDRVRVQIGSAPALAFDSVTSLTLDLEEGNDTVTLSDDLQIDEITVSAGAGNDQINIVAGSGVRGSANVTLNTGDGDDSISVATAKLGGSLVVNAGDGADTLTITDSSIDGAAGDALYVRGTEQILITNSSFTNAGDDGLDLAGDGTTSPSLDLTNVTATGNTNTGLNVTQVASVTDNNGNYSQNAQGLTISQGGLASGVVSLTNTIATANTSQGVVVSDAPSLTLTNVQSTNNGGLGLDASATNLTLNGFTVTGDARLATDGELLISQPITVSGDLELNSDTNNDSIGGNISDADSGSIAVGGTLTLTAGNGNITLDSATNDFSGPVSINSATSAILHDANGLTLGNLSLPGQLTINASGPLDLAGVVNVAGNFSATTNVTGTGGSIGDTSGGSLTVGGNTTLTTGNADVILANANSDFQGQVSLSGHQMLLSDANDLTLASIALTDNLTVQTAGEVTFTGHTAIEGDLIVSTLAHGGSGGAIADIGAGVLTIGGAVLLDSGTQNITLDHSQNDFRGTFSVTRAGSVTVNDRDNINIGSVTTIGDFQVGSAGDIRFVGEVDLGGNLTLHTLALGGTGGSISDGPVGSLSVAGSTSITAGSGDLILDSAGNDFSGAVIVLSAQQVSLTDANNITLAEIDAAGSASFITSGVVSVTGIASIAGDLNIDTTAGGHAGGNVTDESHGSLTVGGTTSIQTGTANIILDHAQNDFIGTMSVQGHSIQLSDANELALADSNAAGNVSLLTTGALSFGGSLTVGGQLNSDTTAQGSTGGSISQQTGSRLNVTGTATFTAGDQSLNLASSSNDFRGLVNVIQATTGSLGDSNSLELGEINIAGTLAIATAGDVTLHDEVTVGAALEINTLAHGGTGGDLRDVASGTLSVSGVANLIVGSAAIVLDNPANDFAGEVNIITARSVTLDDRNALTVGSANTTGQMTLRTAGSVTLSDHLDIGGNLTIDTLAHGGDGDDVTDSSSGQVTVSGLTSIRSGDGSVAMDNALNDLVGPVEIISANHAWLRDANSLTLGDLYLAGDLRLEADGDVLFAGNVVVPGTFTVNSAIGGGSGGRIVDHTGARLTIGGPTTFAAGTGNIELNTNTHDFQADVIITAANDVALADSNALSMGDAAIDGGLTLETAGQVDLKGVIAVADGLEINSLAHGGTGGTITDAGLGSLTVGGPSQISAGDDDISLSGGSHDFASTVQLDSNQNIDLSDINNLILGAATVGQNLTVEAGGAIDIAGRVEVTGTATLTSQGTSGTGNAITDQGSGYLIVGDRSVLTVASGDLQLDADSNDFGGQVTLNVAGNGHISDRNSLSLATASTGSNLTIATAGEVQFTEAVTAGANLVVNSRQLGGTGGDITDLGDGSLTVSGTTVFDAGRGSIVLDDESNDFIGSLSINLASSAVVNDTDDLELGLIDLTGDLTLGTAGRLLIGGLTQIDGSFSVNTLAHGGLGGDVVSGPGGQIDVGTATFNVGSGRVVLNESANDFRGEVIITQATEAELTDANNLILGAVNAASDLSVNTTGFVTFTDETSVGGQLFISTRSKGGLGGLVSDVNDGRLQVAGAVSIDAGDQDVILDNDRNDFQGSVTIAAAQNLSVADQNSLTLGDATVANAANLITGGPVIFAGVLTTAADLVVSTLGGGGTGADIRDSAAGRLIIGGETRLEAGTGNIVLDAVANDFMGSFSLSANNADIRDANALTLGLVTVSGHLTIGNAGDLQFTDTVTVGGNLYADTTNQGGAGGSISDDAHGTLRVGGTTSMRAGSADVTLDDSGNDFIGIVSVTADDVILHDRNALTLGRMVTDGELSVATAGDVTFTEPTVVNGMLTVNTLALGGTGGDILDTDAGELLVAGAVHLAAGDGATILDNPTNDFQGIVSIGSAAALQLDDRNELLLGDVAVSGDALIETGGDLLFTGQGRIDGALTVNTAANGGLGGSIADRGTGQLLVAGDTNLIAGNSEINLSNAGHDFQGVLSVSGADAMVSDTNSLIVGQSTLDDHLTINTAGAVRFVDAITVGGNLAVNTHARGGQGGAITDENLGRLVVGGTTSLNAGDASVQFDQRQNDFVGTTSVLQAHDLVIFDANEFSLGQANLTGSGEIASAGSVEIRGAVEIAGDFAVDTQANGGSGANISDATGGRLIVSGSAVLNAGAGDILLDQTANDFTVIRQLTATNAVLADADDVTLIDAALAGHLGIESAGDVSLTGQINVGGDLTIDTRAVGGDGGNIDDRNTGTLNVRGRTHLISGADDILLGGPNHDFQDLVTMAAADAVTLRDSNDLLLGNAHTTGDVVLTTGGALEFRGAAQLGGNLSLSTLGGGSTGADVTDADGGYVVVARQTTFDVGQGDLTLDSHQNDFREVVNVNAGNVQLHDADHLTLGLVSVNDQLTLGTAGQIIFTDLTSVGGDLAIDSAAIGGSGGSIEDQGLGQLLVGGEATFHAGAGNITLNQAANNFEGTVSVTQANHVTLDDRDNLTFGDVAISDAFVVNTAGDVIFTGTTNVGGQALIDTLANGGTGGAITDTHSGYLTIGGPITLHAGGGVVELDNNQNDFAGELAITSAQHAVLVGRNELVFGSVVLDDYLVVTAGDNITGGLISANVATFDAGGGVGSLNGPLQTAVSQLQGRAQNGGFAVENRGALRVGDFASMFGIRATGPISIVNDDLLQIDEEITSGNDVSLATTDSGADREHLLVQGNIVAGGSVVLAAGDDLTLAAGHSISSAGPITITIDTDDADVGRGGTAQLFGSLFAPTTVTGNADDDEMLVSPPADQDRIAGAIELDGRGGSDHYELHLADQPGGVFQGVITVNDSGHAGSDTGVLRFGSQPDTIRLTHQQVHRAGGETINYGGLEGLTLFTKDGDDLISVESTAAATHTTIDTATGDDEVQLGRDGLLSGIAGALTLRGGEANAESETGDTLTIDDGANTTDSVGLLTANTVQGFGMGSEVGYDGFETMNLTLGSGDDLLIVTSSAEGTTSTIQLGDGDDTLAIGVDHQGPVDVIVSAGSGSNTLDFSRSTAVTIDLDETEAQTVTERGDQVEIIDLFHNFTGSPGADTIVLDMLLSRRTVEGGNPTDGDVGDSLQINVFYQPVFVNEPPTGKLWVDVAWRFRFDAIHFSGIEELIGENIFPGYGVPTEPLPSGVPPRDDSASRIRRAEFEANGLAFDGATQPESELFRTRGASQMANAVTLTVMADEVQPGQSARLVLRANDLQTTLAKLRDAGFPGQALQLVVKVGEVEVTVSLEAPANAEEGWSDAELDRLGDEIERLLREKVEQFDEQQDDLPSGSQALGMTSAVVLAALAHRRNRRRSTWEEQVDQLMGGFGDDDR